MHHSYTQDQLIFCSNCDRGCHTYCAVPALEEAPEGMQKNLSLSPRLFVYTDHYHNHFFLSLDDWFCEVCNSQTGSGSSRPKSKSRVGGNSQSPTPRKRPQHHTADSSSSDYEENEEEEEKEEQEEEEEPEEQQEAAEEESSDPEPAPPKSSHHHNYHHRHHNHHNHSHHNHKSKKESATNGSNHKAKRRHRVASSDNQVVEDEYRYNLDENEGTVPTASTSSGANRHKKRTHQHHPPESVSASATMSSTKQPSLKLKLTVKPNKGKKRADNHGDDPMAVDQDQRVPSDEDHVEPEDDENMLGFFGGKLTKEEADTSRSTPGMRDKERFERAKAAGEAKANPRHATGGTSSHSHHHSNHHSYDAHDAAHADAASDAPKIKMIRFGGYDIDTWYVAPYPEEYSQHPVLFICEFCLKYMKSAYVAGRHKVGLTGS